MPESAHRILDMVETFCTAPHAGKWVEAMEGLSQLIVPGLVYLVNKTEHRGTVSV